MKYLPFISILILQWVVVRTDTPCEANAYTSTTMLDLHKMCGADSAQNCATSAGSGEGFYTGSSAALLDGVLSGDAHRWHSAKGFGEADSLTIDLGRITNINSVRVYPVSYSYRSRCKIYVSQEPQTHVITEANAGELCADLSSLDFFQSVAWETATCLKTGRYVNLIFPANKGDWHEVAEVEVKGEESECVSCPAGYTSPVGSTSIDACEKKCEANHYPTPRVYPPPTSTSAFKKPGSSSKTYDVTVSGSAWGNGQYTIEYSSCYLNGNSYCPHHAFVHENSDPYNDATWNGSPYTGAGNTYAGTEESLNGVDGQWIKIQLPEKVVLTGLTTVSTLYNANYKGRMPKNFKVFACNNDQGDWVEVYHQESTETPTFSSHNGIDNLAVKWQIQPSSATMYNTFAIVVLSLINPGSSTSLVVGEILLYGYPQLHECTSCPANYVAPPASTSIDACELSCAANSYRDDLLQIDFYTGFSGRTWANAKAHAESLHGRLPTNQEMIDYAQFHGGFASHGWIATVSPTASGGKDFIYIDNGGGHPIGDSHVEMHDGLYGYPSWGDNAGADHGWFTHYAVATDLATPKQDLAFCRSCGAATVSYEGSHKTCTRETQIEYVHSVDSMMTFEEAKTYAANQGARLATVSEAKTYLSQNTVTINPDVCGGADTCEQWAWAITDNKNTGQAVLISEPGHPEFTEYYIGASTSDLQNSFSTTSYPISQNTWLRPSWMRDTSYAIDILGNYEASGQIFWFGSYVIITYHPNCDTMCFDSSITPVKVTFSLTFSGSVTAADLNEGRKQSIKIRIAKKLKVATGAVNIKAVHDARRRLLAVTMDVEISAETDEQAAEFSAMEADVVSATAEAMVDSGLDTTVSIMPACEDGVSVSYWSIRKSVCP